MADEPKMIPAPVKLIVGDETFNVFIEEIDLVEMRTHSRFNLKVLCPHENGDERVGLRMAHGLRESQELRERPEPRGLAKKLEEAIEHAKVVAAEHPGTECEQEHLQLAEWLDELRFQRSNVSRMTRAVEEAHRKLREFRRVAMTSPDFNVHVRVEISQLRKQWMHACEVTEQVFEDHGPEILLEAATDMLREAIGGFMVEKQRRPWEP